jgi:hypothetical protein
VHSPTLILKTSASLLAAGWQSPNHHNPLLSLPYGQWLHCALVNSCILCP